MSTSGTSSLAPSLDGSRISRKSTPPRLRGRENSKSNTVCRNVTLYGYCKYHHLGTCPYNHDSKARYTPPPPVPSLPPQPPQASLLEPGRSPASSNPQGVTTLSRNPSSDNSKRLNVDSPSFTPLQPSTSNANHTSSNRPSTISPKAVQAAPFTPKLSKLSPQGNHDTTAKIHHHPHSIPPLPPPLHPSHPPHLTHSRSLQAVPQTLQRYHVSHQSQPLDPSDVHMYPLENGNPEFYDPWSMHNAMQGMSLEHQPGISHQYLAQHNGGIYPGAFFPQPSFAQPLQHHLYTSIPPHKDILLPYQRAQYDFFVPEDLRREFQKRNEALLLSAPRSPSPLPALEHFHSLVSIDSAKVKSTSLFKFPTWMYKAVSSKDGKSYALRRIGGFRLSNEDAIRAMDPWKRLGNSGIVEIYDIFTTREFGDSSLIVVTDYYPAAATLSDLALSNPHNQLPQSNSQTYQLYMPQQLNQGYQNQHPSHHPHHHQYQLHNLLHQPQQQAYADNILVPPYQRSPQNNTYPSAHDRRQSPHRISEQVLWSYLLQVCLALSAVHPKNLSVRSLHPSKILVTWQNRIRLNSCGILDVVTYPQDRLQSKPIAKPLDDFYYLGRLMLCLITGREHDYNSDPADLIKTFPDGYSNKLQDCIQWLITPPSLMTPGIKSIDALVSIISKESLKLLESNLHQTEIFQDQLARSLEDGRIARLLLKMNLILERPEHKHNREWSDTGERYIVKLFRDYVFHAVHADERPNTDLSHILGCMNRLDAGTADTICLTSRNRETSFLVTYREVKRAIEGAFNDLTQSSSTATTASKSGN